MKTRLRRVLLEIEDTDAPGSVLTLEVSAASGYGWTHAGDPIPLFSRYVRLMSTLSEFLKEEK